MTATAPLSLPAPDAKAIPVKLTCNKCAAPAELLVPWLVLDSRAEGWDGVVLSRVLECACGAIDDYTLDAEVHLWITKTAARNAAARLDGRPYDQRITVGGAVIHSRAGRQSYRRPSEALNLLRREADESPGAESWRRLGNFLGKHARDDEAREAWRKASDADADEVLAPTCIADSHFRHGETVEGFGWLCQALERLPRAKITDDERSDTAGVLVEMLVHVMATTNEPIALEAVWQDGEVGGEVLVRCSGVDLRRVRDLDALGDFLARDGLVGLRLKSELPPDDEETQLEAILNRGAIPLWTPPQPTVRATPKVGRNEACPCGSGKKWKRCCGATRP